MSTKSVFGRQVKSFQELFEGSNSHIKLLFGGITALFLLILVGGTVVYYIWASFWSTPPGLGGHFSLQGYKQLFRPVILDTAFVTISFTVIATICALFFGISGAFIALKTDLPGRRAIPYLFIANYLIPSFVLAIAFETVANPTIGILNGILVALPFFTAPPLDTHNVWAMGVIAGVHWAGFVYFLVSGAITAIPSSLEESAALSGASNFDIIRRIDIPLILPGVTIAVVLLITRFIQSFGIPLILGFPDQIFVLATFMYRALTSIPPNFAFGSAIGMIILFVAVVGLTIQRSTKGQEEKYEVIGESDSSKLYKFNIGRFRYPLSIGMMVVLFFLFALPLLTLILVSFMKGFAAPGPTVWTFGNYISLYQSYQTRFVGSLINSLIVATIGATLGMIVSSVASYYIIKSDSYLGALLDFLTLVPAALPSIVIGTAFLWIILTYQFLGLYGTLWAIVLGLTTKFVVYGTRSTNSAFQAVDTSMEEAAELTGASFLTILRKIYYPLIKPGFFAGFTLLFVTYMKVFTIPLFLSSGTNTLYTVVIWNLWQTARIEEAIAMSSILIVIVLGLYALIGWLTDVDILRT